MELIQSFPDGEPISVYTQGDFVDLCRGPHLPSTPAMSEPQVADAQPAPIGAEMNAIRCSNGSTARRFRPRRSSTAHLARLEEIKRRDHRKVGKELDLISIQDEIGPGLVLWHPKGAAIRLLIENFWREQHMKDGYELVYSPHVARLDLVEDQRACRLLP